VTPTEPEGGRLGRDRALAFSDGVFAIAITLLVLNLRVPHVSGHNLDEQLRHELSKEGGVLIGFAISFYVIARYWLVHHRMSLRLRLVDGRFLIINLVLLAFIVFLPFPAEILGNYGSEVTAVVLYAATMVAIGALSMTLWEYASRAHLMGPMTEPERRENRRRSAIPLVVFGTSIPLAFVSTSAAQVWWILLVLYPLLRAGVERRRPHRPAARAASPSRGRPDEGPSTARGPRP